MMKRQQLVWKSESELAVGILYVCEGGRRGINLGCPLWPSRAHTHEIDPRGKHGAVLYACVSILPPRQG